MRMAGVGGAMKESHPRAPQSRVPFEAVQPSEHPVFGRNRLVFAGLLKIPGHAVHDSVSLARFWELSLYVPVNYKRGIKKSRAE